MTTSKTPGGAPGEAMNEAMEQLTRLQAAAMGPMGWMGPAGLEAMQTTMKEVTSFVSARLKKDLETQQKLMACRTLEEVREVQSGAMQEAFEDYRTESERLAAITRDFVEKAGKMPGPSEG